MEFLKQTRTPALRPDTAMHAIFERSAGACLVKTSGPITIDSSPDLRILLLRCLESGNCESLTVDLSGVAYVDTSAIAILLETLRAARAREKSFQLTGLGGQPRHLFEVARLLHLFNQHVDESPSNDVQPVR